MYPVHPIFLFHRTFLQATIGTGINYGELTGIPDTKTFNSILSAACSEHYPASVQKTVLDLIQFLGSFSAFLLGDEH